MKNIKGFKMHIKTTTFNLAICSDEQSRKEFCFRTKHIDTVAGLIGWNTGRTDRKRYHCNEIAATCIILRRLAATCHWSDLEKMFGMRSYILSDVFWEVWKVFLTVEREFNRILQKRLERKDRNVYWSHPIQWSLTALVGGVDGRGWNKTTKSSPWWSRCTTEICLFRPSAFQLHSI